MVCLMFLGCWFGSCECVCWFDVTSFVRFGIRFCGVALWL